MFGFSSLLCVLLALIFLILVYNIRISIYQYLHHLSVCYRHPPWPISSALIGVEIAVDLILTDSYFNLSTQSTGLPVSAYSHSAMGRPSMATAERIFPPLTPLGSGITNTAVGRGSSMASNITSAVAGNDLRRLMDRQIPQVFITVSRSEQQVYATSLRRQLLRQGILVRRRLFMIHIIDRIYLH